MDITCMRATRKFLYDIRWFMDYADGRSVKGFWGKGAREKSASKQPREGLIKVGIEVNDKLSNISKRVCTIEAQNFERFEWNVSTNIPAAKLQNLDGTIKLVPFHEGLSLVGKDGSKSTFFIDGTIEIEEATNGN